MYRNVLVLNLRSIKNEKLPISNHLLLTRYVLICFQSYLKFQNFFLDFYTSSVACIVQLMPSCIDALSKLDDTMEKQRIQIPGLLGRFCSEAANRFCLSHSQN